MFQLLLCTFLLPWQTQSCSYPWQMLLQRLLSQLVTEVGDECWHHWLIGDRSWYFSEKWDVIGRKWIGLESKSKQFMCWSFVMEEEELVEGLEKWHEQTFLSFVLSAPVLFFGSPFAEAHPLGTTGSFSDPSPCCWVCRNLAVMRLGYSSDLHHWMVSLHSCSLLVFILSLLGDCRAYTAGERSFC